MSKCTLQPGEVCLYCGHVGEAKKQPKKKPTCHVCNEGFTRARKWRLFRGKRVHCDCAEKLTPSIE